MDAKFNAKYDVEVLSAAFNMDKAEFMGKLKLIDDFTTFDSDRFEIIMENSDMIAPVTAEELALMADVQAVLVDSEWFQIYDNNNKFTEKYVASGMYWNYFYNVWKTVSHSPFSNAVVFVANTATIAPPKSVNFNVTGKDTKEGITVFTLEPVDGATLAPTSYKLIQNEEATKAGIAIHPYGAVIFPAGAATVTLTLDVSGTVLTAGAALTPDTAVDTVITFAVSGAG